MIRNVVMIELRADADREVVAEVQAGFRALNPPGCVSYTLGADLGLREGNWSYAIVADFEDEAAYREYDLERVHNELRERQAPHVERVARVQFSLDA